MATFTSSLESIGAWRGSRLPLTRYVPLAGLLAWASWCASGAEAGAFPVMGVMALCLIAQFRLWDDIVDRARDRHAHPQRVLAQAASATPFVGAVIAFGVVNASSLAWLRSWVQAASLVALSALLALWYRLHRARGLLHSHVLLLKYPAFVVLIAAPAADPAALAIAAGSSYAAMCAFELLEHSSVRARDSGALAAHALALSIAPMLARWSPAAAAASVLLAAVLAVAGCRWQRGAAGGGWRYVPFAAAALGAPFLISGDVS